MWKESKKQGVLNSVLVIVNSIYSNQFKKGLKTETFVIVSNIA